MMVQAQLIKPFKCFITLLCIFSFVLSSKSLAGKTNDPISCSSGDEKMKNFTLPMLDLSSKKKKYFHWSKKDNSNYLISFYATWCVPCQEEVKLLLKKQRELGKKNLKILVISIDEKQKKILKKIKKFNSNPKNQLTFLHDRMKIVYRRLKLNTLPSIFMVDEKGNIRLKRIKTFSEKQLPKMVDCLSSKSS